MSKTCKTKEEAEATLQHYRDKKDTDGYVVERGEEYLVYRKGDNKVLKSVNYSPADLASLMQ